MNGTTGEVVKRGLCSFGCRIAPGCVAVKGDGVKEMLLVDEVDNREFLVDLFNAMYEELSALKPKKKK